MAENINKLDKLVSIVKEEVSRKWIIKNYSTVDCWVSRIFSESNESSKWKIKFWPKNSESDRCKMQIIASSKQLLQNEIDVDCTFYIFDGVFVEFKYFILHKFDPSNSTYDLYMSDNIQAFVVKDQLKNGICIVAVYKKDNNIKENSKPKQGANEVANVTNSWDLIFKYPKFADFTISVNGKNKDVHQAILASLSSKFAVMFENSKRNLEFYEIEDLNEVAVDAMIQFIYTNKLNICNIKQAIEFYKAADIYGVLSLKTLCENYIDVNITPLNAFSILILADEFKNKESKRKVISSIIIHIGKLSSWEHYECILKNKNGCQLLAEILLQMSENENN